MSFELGAERKEFGTLLLIVYLQRIVRLKSTFLFRFSNLLHLIKKPALFAVQVFQKYKSILICRLFSLGWFLQERWLKLPL